MSPLDRVRQFLQRAVLLGALSAAEADALVMGVKTGDRAHVEAGFAELGRDLVRLADFASKYEDASRYSDMLRAITALESSVHADALLAADIARVESMCLDEDTPPGDPIDVIRKDGLVCVTYRWMPDMGEILAWVGDRDVGVHRNAHSDNTTVTVFGSRNAPEPEAEPVH